MEAGREFYAWVKVVDDAKAPPVRPKRDPNLPTPPFCTYDLTIKSGDKWPKRQAAVPAGPKPNGVSVCVDGSSDTLLTLADPKIHGRWEFDESFAGKSERSFEVLHFIGSRDQAVQWLREREGKEWLVNQRHYALLRFVAPSGEVAGPDSGDGRSRQATRTDAAPDPCAAFPHDAWREDYKAFVTAPTDLFSDSELKQLDLDDPGPSKIECGAVRARLGERPHRESFIRARACDQNALAYVLAGEVPLDPILHPFTIELISKMVAGLRRPIYQLKAKHARARPWACCSGLLPLLDPSDPCFPAHPAYPAGHAAMAYTAARLFSADTHAPGVGPYWERAASVSDDRIVAGLHYPTDIDAGGELARQMVPMLLGKVWFKALVKAAREEW